MNFSNEKKAIRDLIGDNDLFSTLVEAKCMLAGGALTSIYRNKPVVDLDLYFRSKDSLADVVEYLSGSFVCMSKSDRSAMFVGKNIDVCINVIYFKFFKDLRDVFESFDFTCCMCGYDFASDCFDSHPEFYRDTLLGNIVYSAKSNYPLAALLRVNKYLKKGFKISKKEMIRIILHCQKNPIESMDDVADQVGSLYGTNIKEVVGEIEPFSIDALIEKLSEVEDTDFEPKEKKVIKVDWDKELFRDLYFIVDAGDKTFLCRNNKIISLASNEDIIDFGGRSYRLEFPFYVYKHVRDAGPNKMVSFFRDDFRYAVGQEVSDSRMGIYTYLPERLPKGQYRRRQDALAIEIRVDRAIDIVKNITVSQGEIRIKRGTVTRIVKEEELDGANSKISNGYIDEQQQVLRYGRIGGTDTSEVREDWFVGSNRDLSDQ